MYVFFVKQKTAYEMRISDWMSDVCSSDLAAALRDQARAGGLRFEAYLTKDQADWLLEQIERGRFADPSEAVFLTVQNFIEMEPHGDLRDELLRRRIQAARSEEHTSELQSLMRISYAVFCLKKKTIII